MPNQFYRLRGNNSEPALDDAVVGAGSFALNVGGQVTEAMSGYVSASEMQGKLDSLTTVGSGAPGNVEVSLWSVEGQDLGYEIEFVGDLANQAVAMTIESQDCKASANTITVTETQAGAAPSYATVTIESNFVDGDDDMQAATQTLTFTPPAERGMWSLNESGYNWNQSPEGNPPEGWSITGSADAGTVTITKNDTASGQSPLPYADNVFGEFLEYETDPGSPNVTQMYLEAGVDEGTFTISNSSFETAGPFNFDVDASTLETGLESLGGGYFAAVTGANTSADPFVITSDDSRTSPGFSAAETTPLRKPVTLVLQELQEGAEGPDPEDPDPEDPPRSDDELNLTVDEWVAYAQDFDRMELDGGNGTIHLPCYDQDFIPSIEAALPSEILSRVVFGSRGGRGCVG